MFKRLLSGVAIAALLVTATFSVPHASAAIVRQALGPFQDLGVMGAVASRSRSVGGTDSTSSNNAGLAGIGFGQDPIEYNKTSAIAIAATLYELAMRDEMVPRFSKADMPPPAPARTGGSQ